MSENNGEKKRVRHTLRVVRHLFEGMISFGFIILIVLHFRALIYDQAWLIVWIVGLSVIFAVVWIIVESSLVEDLIDLAD